MECSWHVRATLTLISPSPWPRRWARFQQLFSLSQQIHQQIRIALVYSSEQASKSLTSWSMCFRRGGLTTKKKSVNDMVHLKLTHDMEQRTRTADKEG